MKNIFRIFQQDMKSIGTNWVAAILIGGLIVLPSLYAWFNIGAQWDPYGKVDQIPVGIVNEDEGATVRDEDIDAGDELVETLKDNDSLDWRFVNQEKAMDKLEYGDYFAVIVIPEGFSENLGTVLDDDPQKAQVEYYVNEKTNAISPKITSQGASVIVDQISSKFISTVNGVIFDIFNQIGVELEESLPDIKQFEDYVFTMEDKLPEVHDVLEESASDADEAEDIIDRAQEMVPDAKDATDDGLDTINDTSEFLDEAEDRLNEMAPEIKEDLEKVQRISGDVNDVIDRVNSADIDFSKGQEIGDQLQEDTDEAIDRIETVQDNLEQLKEQNESQPDDESPDDEENTEEEEQEELIDDAITRLDTLKEGLEEAQGNAEEIRSFVDEKKDEVDGTIDDLQDVAQSTDENIDAFVKEYKENIEPTVFAEVADAKDTLSTARGILEEIQSTIPEVEKILNRTDDNLGEGKEVLDYALGEYPYIHDKVDQLADRIRDIQGETDLEEIIDLLLNDPESEESFFEEPVKLNENELFPVPTYGAGMTPFYTVLAFWVGALLLISLLSTDVKDPEAFPARQVYFGKLLTFITIGICQALVVTLGDMYLIDAYVVEPFWFVIFGIASSLLFMVIVYTLVSVFGDVGKSLAIVYLVLQIAGSGGTYPIELLPEFFQKLSPFLPFTYAVDLMREAVGGIVWERVYTDLTSMAIFAVLFLLIGIFLKKIINRRTNTLMKKSRETGLFH